MKKDNDNGEISAQIECPEIGEVLIKIRSSARSRNFRMWIDSPDSVVLTKPIRAPLGEALKFARANAVWIAKNIAAFSPAIALADFLEKNPYVFAEGAKLSVWLKPTDNSEFFVRTKTELGVVYKSSDRENSVEKIFIDFAREVMEAEIKKISAETGLRFSKISVRGQKSRWASRSSTGNLSLNWRIMLLPSEFQQYVFRHELAHVKFMDHSTAFWIFLNRLMPQAKKIDAALTKSGAEIFNVGR